MRDHEPLHLIVGGSTIGASARETRPVLNPATGEEIARLPMATKDDVAEAATAAGDALRTWRRQPAPARSAILKRAAALMRERCEIIAYALTREQGKPVAEARGELGFAAEIFDWFAEEGKRLYGRIIPGRSDGSRQIVELEPVGAVAAFSPWNFPLVTSAKKIAPALATGCSVILKPAEETPLAPLLMVKCLEDAGLPPGVLNVVFGDPATISEQLIAHKAIRKITFTGSVPVGKRLAHLAADHMKRVTMELGGHAPVIVFKDAPIAKVASLAVTTKFRNAGQICSSPTRFFVEEDAYGAFVSEMSGLASSLRVGDGFDPDIQMGPLANLRRITAMEELTQDARLRGARASGGNRLNRSGFFFQPTILHDVDPAARVMNEEPFGPLAAIVPFRSAEDALSAANSLDFGLAAYVFTASPRLQRLCSETIEAGLVGINTFAISQPETPFGGVKGSGYGYEGGLEGIEPYLVRKFVHADQTL